MKNSARGELVEPCDLCASVVDTPLLLRVPFVFFVVKILSSRAPSGRPASALKTVADASSGAGRPYISYFVFPSCSSW